MRLIILKLFIVIFFVSSCSLAPKYKKPELEFAEKYSEPHLDGTSVANLKWWDVFGDEKLKKLVRESLNNNKDLALALARIEESKALVLFTRADQFPFLNITSNITRNDLGANALANSSFGVLGDLTFEVDLWAKLQNATAAQRAAVLSSTYAMHTVSSSLVSQVAQLYFTLIDIDNRIIISKETLNNRKKAKNLIGQQFSKGIVSELELNQAQVEEISVAVTLISLERERQQVEHALLVLLGRSSGAIMRTNSLLDLGLKQEMPTDVPAQILQRRPDLLALEQNIEQQLYLEGVAEAQRLPSLQLFGTVGLSSVSSTDIFSDEAKSWSIGGSIFSPLLNLGKNKARVEAQKARVEQAKKNYEQAVLKSIQEVQDALIEIQTYKQEFAQRQAQIKISKHANVLTRARYDNGVASYVEVLDIERSRYNAELSSSVAYRLYLSSLIKLYRALGGGWEQVN